MVDSVMPEVIAVSIALVAVVAELLHLRRIKQVKFLAFGPGGRPALWTWAAPVLRVLGLAISAWGFASLWFVVEAKVHSQNEIAENEYKHLVLIVDVSPSMHLKDAGPDGDKGRRKQASDVLESLFNRIPMRQFKISVIGVYSEAKMLLEDSKDHEVVRHIVETMPLWHAYKPGKTKLMSGIELAAKTASKWRPGSTYVLMMTDGDTVPTTGMPTLPSSIEEFLVVGVGDPNTGTFIDDHVSRQDVNTLRQVANRLRGIYHNGNNKHLTSKIVGRFNRQDDEDEKKTWTRREWSLIAVIVGSGIFAFVPIGLHYFGGILVAGVRRSPGKHR